MIQAIFAKGILATAIPLLAMIGIHSTRDFWVAYQGYLDTRHVAPKACGAYVEAYNTASERDPEMRANIGDLPEFLDERTCR